MKKRTAARTLSHEWQVPRLAYLATEEVVERHLMQRQLRDLYHDIRTFCTHEAVLAAMDREIPDLVVIDYLVPPFGGVALVETIRNKVAGGDIPDIIFCYRTELEDTERVFLEDDCHVVIQPQRLVESPRYFQAAAAEFVRLLKRRQGELARA